MGTAHTISSATPFDDRTALRRYARDGDPEAFEFLWRRYGTMVYATCLRLLKTEADAEDAAQETFLRLASQAGSVRSNTAAWLHAAAMGCSVDQIRRSSTRRRAETRAAVPADAGAGGMSWDQVEPLLDEALASLDASDRALLVSRFLCGRSQADLAGELGLSHGAVSRRVSKALDRLRSRLAERGLRAGDAGLLAVALAGVSAVSAPSSLAEPISKIALVGATGRIGGGLSKGALFMGATVIGLLAASTAFITTGRPTPATTGVAAVLSSTTNADGAAPDRPSRAIGPFELVSAGERSAFDRGVWIRRERLVINHGTHPVYGEANRSTLEILDRVRGDEGVTFTTRVSDIRPLGVEFSRFELGTTVEILASFDDAGRLVLKPLTEGVQLGRNEPRWFGVRPPLGWPERALIPENTGEGGLLGPWTEAERIPMTIDNREILLGTSSWRAAVYRIVSWEKRDGYARVESIHAGGRDPRLIGTRFRLLIREDDDGYTIAYFPPGERGDGRWPSSFKYSASNPVTVITARDNP